MVTLTPQPAGVAPHSHRVDGDGTAARVAGYRLTDVTLPDRADRVGTLSFRLLGPDGRPVRAFIDDLTKQLHAYVVRSDLTGFRHVHPVLGSDGTWRARVDLGDPGRYRVVTEFIPKPHTDLTPVVLGAPVTVPGAWRARPVPDGTTADDGVVEVQAPASVPTGLDQQLTLTISDGQGDPVNLGTYLGAYAHLTAFDVRTGAFVHAHPLGEPTPVADGSTLDFHVTVAHPGRYRVFVQLRVDGFLHTLALTLPVVAASHVTDR
jgi:hypothetical protein